MDSLSFRVAACPDCKRVNAGRNDFDVSSGECELQRPAGVAPDPEFPRQIENEIPFLRRAVRRWHREKPDADDLVQDTLVQALANAHLWQPGTNLRAWLSTIMRNEFLGAIARSKRSTGALQSIAAADPGEAADAREVRLILRDVAAALGRLPQKQQSAVFLVGVEGKSYREVAKTMGSSVGAVRSDLARARDRLRNAVHTVDERSPRARLPARSPLAAAAQRALRGVAAFAAAGAD
jgi:RNA polymerase sigma-70 factor (ECF subfamily)